MNDGSRVLPCTDEIVSLVKTYRRKYFGFAARKLYHKIREHYIGITEETIQRIINADPDQRMVHSTFQNKPTLKPVESSTVMGTIQIDLVDIKTKFPGLAIEQYRYVSVLEDIFTRYNWLRPLPNKKADGVVEHCYEIFRLFGAPETLQSDRGGEFMASFVGMCSKLGIKMVKSRPRHPQSQGKVSTIVIEKKFYLITNGVDPLLSCLNRRQWTFCCARAGVNHIQCGAVITRSIFAQIFR